MSFGWLWILLMLMLIPRSQHCLRKSGKVGRLKVLRTPEPSFAGSGHRDFVWPYEDMW